MYLTDANDNVARTKNQLQVVTGNEEEPDIKFNRGESDTYIISKILDKKIENKKTFYKIKWKGQTIPSWEPSNILDRTEDLRQMRKEFNDRN